MSTLSGAQIMRVVTLYIGVEGGYLGDFSYRTHAEFYPAYCDLNYEPDELKGTTRERFIHILKSAPAHHQSRILRGVVERFPVGAFRAPASRTQELRETMLNWASSLKTAVGIPTPNLDIRSAAVERALRDAEALIETTGPPSAVDRIHTALHAYLEALCIDSGIAFDQGAGLTGLFKRLRQEHPNLQPTGPRADDLTKILRSTASILDALNPVRNRASGAHPNPEVLQPPEAMLVVNLTRSLLHFINARVEAS